MDIALTIGEERGPQPIGFFGNKNIAEREPQECRGRRGAIGNILKVVITEPGQTAGATDLIE